MTKDRGGEKCRGRVLRKGSRKGRGAGEAELICGLEYASLADVERGHESERCNYPGLGQDPYRWPSLSMSVPVHEVMTPKKQTIMQDPPAQNRNTSIWAVNLLLHLGPHTSVCRPVPKALVDILQAPASTIAVTNSSSSTASPTSVALKQHYDGVLMALSVSEAAPEVDRDVRTPGGAFSTGLGSGDNLLETNGTSGSERKWRAYERLDSEMVRSVTWWMLALPLA